MANHVLPINDLRGHVEEGVLCPCMPRVREDGELVIHNSYDGREIGEVCAKALDMLGCALADHGHTWSPELRDAYEHAIDVLAMHYDIHEPTKKG